MATSTVDCVSLFCFKHLNLSFTDLSQDLPIITGEKYELPEGFSLSPLLSVPAM